MKMGDKSHKDTESYMQSLSDAKECWKIMAENEQATGKKYQQFARIRPDLFWTTFDADRFEMDRLGQSSEPIVHTSYCDSLHSLSDKFMVGNRAGMEIFFNRFDDILAAKDTWALPHGEPNWGNSERYTSERALLFVMKKRRVKMIQHAFEEIQWCKYGNWEFADKSCTAAVQDCDMDRKCAYTRMNADRKGDHQNHCIEWMQSHPKPSIGHPLVSGPA